jgi:hypothetical protein
MRCLDKGMVELDLC